jgi:Flp pilus assembly protein TadD
MGYNAYLSRHWAEAEQTFQRVLAINSQHPRARNNLAMVFAGQGRYAEAFDMFCSVNGDAAAHCNLAFAFAAQGDFEASRRAYQTALNLQPSLPAAKAGLVRMADVQSRLAPTQFR